MKIIYFLIFASIATAGTLIDEKDRKILEPYFNYLLVHEDLGYVLLGAKPAIFTGYVHHLSWWEHPLDSLGSLHYFHKGNQHQLKAWEIWKKYSSQLSKHFLITEETPPSAPLCREVFVIHRKLFCKVINENREIFEGILKRKITGEMLFEEAKEKPLFSEILKENQILLGIILGYGKENATLFSQKKMENLEMFPKEEDKISSVDLPVFRAKFDNLETIKLRKKYLACRDKIKTTFLQNNSFDQILKILFADETY